MMGTLDRVIDSYQDSALLLTAWKIGLPETLHQKSLSATEIANKLELDPQKTLRFLNALVTLGLCEKNENTFTLSKMGLELVGEKSLYYKNKILLLDQYVSAWFETTRSLRNANASFETLHGENIWSFRLRHPEQDMIFNNWMRASTSLQAEPLAEALSSGRYIQTGDKVLDVGGGKACAGENALKTKLLTKIPQMTYSVFDLEQGDMFQQIPPGFNVYILKSVLHDWKDEDCLKILKNCQATKGRTLIIERNFAYDGSSLSYLDMHMMNITGGQERTREAYVELFHESGFKVSSIRETENNFLIFDLC